jgi:hypothetical protein
MEIKKGRMEQRKSVTDCAWKCHGRQSSEKVRMGGYGVKSILREIHDAGHGECGLGNIEIATKYQS